MPQREPADRAALLRKLSLLREVKMRHQNTLEQKQLDRRLSMLSREREMAERHQKKERRSAEEEGRSARSLPPDQSARVMSRLQNIRLVELRRSSCPKCRRRLVMALFRQVGLNYG